MPSPFKSNISGSTFAATEAFLNKSNTLFKSPENTARRNEYEDQMLSAMKLPIKRIVSLAPL